MKDTVFVSAAVFAFCVGTRPVPAVASLRLFQLEGAVHSAWAQPSVEHLIVISSDDIVLAVKAGTRSSVALDVEIDALLAQPGARLTLLHNHPRSGGLSLNDLWQLAKPGVERVVAVGEDGSHYDAARGPRYDVGLFENHQYAPAHDEVVRQLRATPLNLCGSLDGHVAHLTSLGLHEAGVIEYHAILQGGRGTSDRKYRALFALVVEAAARRLR